MLLKVSGVGCGYCALIVHYTTTFGLRFLFAVISLILLCVYVVKRWFSCLEIARFSVLVGLGRTLSGFPHRFGVAGVHLGCVPCASLVVVIDGQTQ